MCSVPWLNKGCVIGVCLMLVACDTERPKQTSEAELPSDAKENNIEQECETQPVPHYQIENYRFQLVKGQARLQDKTIDGTSGKVSISEVINQAGDIDQDGRVDQVAVVTMSSGGSGNFYYLVAAVNGDCSYQAIPAVFLGDRITVQSLEILSGEKVSSDTGMIVLYLGFRKVAEPMTTKPSVVVSRLFRVIDNQLIQVEQY